MVLAVELESAPVAASCMEGRPSHTVSSACLQVPLQLQMRSLIRFLLPALRCDVQSLHMDASGSLICQLGFPSRSA